MARIPRRAARALPALFVALLAAAGCASPAGPPGPSPADEGSADDIGATFSLYGWAPRYRGSVTMDGAQGKPDGSPWAAGGGILGEIRPPRWVAMFDLGWALTSDDLGLEAVHPELGAGDVDHTLRFVEVTAGPCLLDLPAAQGRSDGLIRTGPRTGSRPTGPSRLRIDPFVGVRGFQHTVDTDFAPDVPGEAEERIWADPVAGLRLEASPSPRVAFHAKGDAAGFGVASQRAWRASASASLRVGRSTWITAGWSVVSVDYERGDSGRYRFNARLGGPTLALDFWF